MKKTLVALLVSLAAGAAMAAADTDRTGVTTSTDPAKAAAVERHAEELKAQQGSSQHLATNASGTSGTKHGAKKASKHKAGKNAAPAKQPG